MVIFYKTKNFVVDAWDNPHIDRGDGGHIIIKPKISVENRWDLNLNKSKEIILLSILVGEAMKIGMNKNGIPVERINFQDNGNWGINTKEGPKFHLHLYGRAKNSINQKRGEALYFPDKKTKFWKKLNPLNGEDIKEILKQIKLISKRKKYKGFFDKI